MPWTFMWVVNRFCGGDITEANRWVMDGRGSLWQYQALGENIVCLRFLVKVVAGSGLFLGCGWDTL